MTKFHDVVAHLVDVAGFDEGTKQEYQAAVNEHYKDDIEALSDEEKELRRAPIDRLAGSMPAIFVGGITQAALDNIIAKAIAAYEAGKAKAVSTAPDEGKAVTAPVDKPVLVEAPASAEIAPTDEQIAAFLARQRG